jgi:hypothetical protein
LFPSETDAPVEAFAWPAGPVTAAGVLAQVGAATGTKVEEVTFTELLRGVPSALRGNFFDLLLALVEHLSGVKVFKLGAVRKTVYVVGTTAGGSRAGMKTEVVET